MLQEQPREDGKQQQRQTAPRNQAAEGERNKSSLSLLPMASACFVTEAVAHAAAAACANELFIQIYAFTLRRR
jgi:hypothetical protein